jgi:ATP-binding cassette subfamily C (CFTR/MRP) protein 1
MTELCRLIAQLVLLLLTQALLTIGAPFLFLVLYFLQKLYLHTSRQIRFLDIELRAEVLSNFLETVRPSSPLLIAPLITATIFGKLF